jgi:hypothetical protein
MFFQGFYEHHIGVTSVFSQSFSFIVDGLSSVGDPNEIFLGYLNFFLDVFSVSGGFISGSFVEIGDGG